MKVGKLLKCKAFVRSDEYIVAKSTNSVVKYVDSCCFMGNT